MYKLIILFLSFFGPLVLGNGYTYAQEQTCISSDGSPTVSYTHLTLPTTPYV